MRDYMLGLLIILLVLKYVMEWGMEVIETTGDIVLRPVNRSIRCLSEATGIKVEKEEAA